MRRLQQLALPREGKQASIQVGLLYWWFFAGMAAFGPFLSIYYKQIGLSDSQIGLLSAVIPLATAILAPVMGMLADRWNAHRLILRLALIGSAVVVTLMIRASSFEHFLPLIILLALVFAPITSLIDSFAVTISQRTRTAFGRMRVNGSIAFMIMAFVLGRIMGNSVQSYFLLIYAACLLMCCVSTIGLSPMQGPASQRFNQNSASMLRQPALLILLLTGFLSAIGSSIIFNFQGLFVKHLGGSTALVGAASSVAALSEMPMMFLGGWMVLRLGGRRMVALSLVMYILRALSLSLMPSADWIVPVQILHGFSFGIFMMASVNLVYELAGAELAATAQGLLASAVSFGVILGAIAGGIIIDHYGFVNVFRASALMALLALLVFVAGSRRFRSVG